MHHGDDASNDAPATRGCAVLTDTLLLLQLVMGAHSLGFVKPGAGKGSTVLRGAQGKPANLGREGLSAGQQVMPNVGQTAWRCSAKGHHFWRFPC